MSKNEVYDNTDTILKGIFKNSEKNKNIFMKNIKNVDESNNFSESELKRIVYQTCFDIVSTKKVGKKLNTIVQDLKRQKVGWNHTCYEEEKTKQNEQDEFLINPFQVEEGVNECKKCKSKKVVSYQRQERSADEPMTTYCTCVKCGVHWSYSG